jgi:hypothetical protein
MLWGPMTSAPADGPEAFTIENGLARAQCLQRGLPERMLTASVPELLVFPGSTKRCVNAYGGVVRNVPAALPGGSGPHKSGSARQESGALVDPEQQVHILHGDTAGSLDQVVNRGKHNQLRAIHPH